MSKVMTMKDWKGDFNSCARPFLNEQTLSVEVNEDIYDNFLESLPPFIHTTCFQNSEPVTDNNCGIAMYATFQKIDNKFYFVGDLTKAFGKRLPSDYALR